MEFLNDSALMWGVFALLTVVCVFAYLRGHRGPDQTAIDTPTPTLQARMRHHHEQRDALTTDMQTCTAILIRKRGADGSAQDMWLPNTPPCRRMALASYEQGAEIYLQQGGDGAMNKLYQGLDMFQAKTLAEGVQRTA